ncbi:MAG: T9SS type A sorting domain-containing protein [Bacteroidota bacterium]
MKKVLLLISFILTSVVCFAQTPDWAWANGSGGAAYDCSSSVTTDAFGNVYIAGYFTSPSISFGNDTLFNINNGYGQNRQAFFAKFDANGIALWARIGISTMYANASSIAVDHSGNVYVTGDFKNTITFNSTVTLQDIHPGWGDIFVVKYNSSGQLLWAKRYGGTASELSNSIAIDTSDNLYLAGNFNSDTIRFGSTVLTNAQTGSIDMFLTKLDTSGNVIWARSAGGTNNDDARSVAVDPWNNVFITGYETSPSISFDSYTFVNTGSFLVKYNTNGLVIWADLIVGTGMDMANSVAIDALGNSYIAGQFESKHLYFEFTTLTNPREGVDDIFIVKTDPDGNFLWANRAGGMGFDEAFSIAVDALGNSYIVGFFGSDTICFGSNILTTTTTGYWDIFIAKYSTNGNNLWARNAAGTKDDIAYSVAVNDPADIYVTGEFRSPYITFNNDYVYNHSYVTDLFLAKIASGNFIISLNNSSSITLSPNPFSQSTLISFGKTYSSLALEVFNLQGQMLEREEYRNCYEIVFQRNQLSPGMYFIKLTLDGKIVETRKEIVGD